MRLSVRLFIVNGGSIYRLSIKKMEDFYRHHRNSLPEYANSVIDVAYVCVEVEGRSIHRIVRVDCASFTVDSLGGLIDDSFEGYGDDLDLVLDEPKVAREGNVLIASQLFQSKKQKLQSWEIQQGALKKTRSLLKLKT